VGGVTLMQLALTDLTRTPFAEFHARDGAGAIADDEQHLTRQTPRTVA
jgi:hypothetical protein